MQTNASSWLVASTDAFRRSRSFAVTTALVLTIFIGVFDYVTGAQISLSAFYLIPVTIGAWFVGLRFGLFIATACVAVWVAGNIGGGEDEFSTPFLILWNGGIQLASYVVVVVAVTRIHTLQLGLEVRVSERAAALTKEITERERLQRELLQISEREQRRIGQDLHDGLCQHLAGTAIAGQVLREKLTRQQLNEAGDAHRIVELIQEGIVLSRSSAKGLNPVEFDAAGLMLALQEFADTTSKLFKISCRFECESPVLVHNAETAEHMYRIVQEAVRNAINHGQPGNVVIRLDTVEDGQELRIEDDGVGMPEKPSGEGMGLRIMQNRALVIGGVFRIESAKNRGTSICCSLPYLVEAEGTES
jgi:signal transduction histidine kinase